MRPWGPGVPIGSAEVVEMAGPYRVVRRIGSGGMASIFEAVDTRLGHRVALKRLHPHIADRPGAAERFLREGRAAARVRHPHVVQVFALDSDDSGAYLAMELLEGSDLGAVLAKEGRLGVETVLELLLPVIAAVGAAHDAGVLHRDLKPSNIFVSNGAGGRPWPKVVDFGVSKVLDQDGGAPTTASDGVIGTAVYMAPEQARAARDASFQSDQYSLAIILYQCVTGQVPFATTGMYDLLVAIMTAPLTPPSQRAAGIPDGFDEVVLRATSRNPRDRFPSVRAFGAALLPFARERDRVAWSAELRDGPVAAPGDPGRRARGESDDGKPVHPAEDPATMPPTARGTQAAAREERRKARRVVGALLGSAAVIVSALTWRGSRVRQAPPTNAAGSATITAPDPQPRPSPPAETRPTYAEAPVVPTGSRAPTAPSSHGDVAPKPGVLPARGVPTPPRVSPASAPVPAPAPALSIGDNGSPILP
jgi:eukaryotic-like serine/threonine-protein kinase